MSTSMKNSLKRKTVPIKTKTMKNSLKRKTVPIKTKKIFRILIKTKRLTHAI